MTVIYKDMDNEKETENVLRNVRRMENKGSGFLITFNHDNFKQIIKHSEFVEAID